MDQSAVCRAQPGYQPRRRIALAGSHFLCLFNARASSLEAEHVGTLWSGCAQLPATRPIQFLPDAGRMFRYNCQKLRTHPACLHTLPHKVSIPKYAEPCCSAAAWATHSQTTLSPSRLTSQAKRPQETQNHDTTRTALSEG